MKELGLWTRASNKAQRARLKAQRKFSEGKFLLSTRELASGFGESAAVHFVQSDLVSFSDESDESDDDHAVARTMETLSVAGSDAPALKTGERSQVFRRDLIPMNVDKVLANFDVLWISRGGNAGRGRVEHREILQVSPTH